MRLVIAAVGLITCFLILMSGQAFAIDVGWGVEEGDTFTFDYNATVNDYNLVGSPGDLWLLDVVEIRIEVAGFDETSVYYNQTFMLGNGTQINTTEEEGSSYRSPEKYAWFLWGSNMTTDDSFFPFAGVNECKINETIMTSYEGIERETNHLEIDIENLGGSGTIPDYNEHYDLYFDKLTGMTTESHVNIVEVANSSATGTIDMVLKETNIWLVPELPPLVILMMSIAVISIIIVFFKKPHQFRQQSTIF